MKIKYEYPKCPICSKNKHVISDGNSYSSGGSSSSSDKNIITEGLWIDVFYCTKCYVDFKIEIRYKKYSKNKLIGRNGPTGSRG